MKQLTSRVVALERAADVVERKLDSSDRLRRVQEIIDQELEWAVTQARQPGANRAALVDVILRLAGEVRHQQHLQLTLMATLVDFKVVREFQEVVVATIRDESPEAAGRIVARLKERRALRPHASVTGFTAAAGGHDVA